jgi:hypothetical protein
MIDDDPIREAERAAAEYVAWTARQERVRDTAAALCNEVWANLLSSATANLVGQPDAGDDASARAYELLEVDDLEVLRQAVVCGMWPFAEQVATAQLEELRDFHYVDERAGLVPVPPSGRHRAPEEAT